MKEVFGWAVKVTRAEKVLVRKGNVDHFAIAFAGAVASVGVKGMLGCSGERCKVVSYVGRA